jgi:dihydroneopterin aldolase
LYSAGGGGGGNKLILHGLQFHGFHGVQQEKQTLRPKFVVDIDTWMDLIAPASLTASLIQSATPTSTGE